MKNVISTVPTTISHGVNTTANPCEIANVFNNYFASVAKLHIRTLIIPINTFLNT